MEGADAEASQDNPACGDLLKVFLKVADNRITDIRFQAYGCSSTIAAGSILTEMAKGKTLDEALAITDRVIEEALGGLPITKRHCSLLAAETLHAAVKSFQSKRIMPA